MCVSGPVRCLGYRTAPVPSTRRSCWRPPQPAATRTACWAVLRCASSDPCRAPDSFMSSDPRRTPDQAGMIHSDIFLPWLDAPADQLALRWIVLYNSQWCAPAKGHLTVAGIEAREAILRAYADGRVPSAVYFLHYTAMIVQIAAFLLSESMRRSDCTVSELHDSRLKLLATSSLPPA